MFSSKSGVDLVVNRLGFVADYSSINVSPTDVLAKEMFRWVQKKDVNTIPWTFSCFPSDQWKSDFGSALLEYVNGTKTWDDVVKVAQDLWQEKLRSQVDN